MMRKHFLSATLAISAVALFCWRTDAQTNSARALLRVRHRGGRIILKANGRSYPLVLNNKISAANLQTVKLLFANRKRSDTFIVIDACGWSKSRPDDRQCGAGEECDLVWVKLDAGWHVKDAQSILYESCWQTIDPDDDGYQITGEQLQMKITNFSRNTNSSMRYDTREPEKGFQIITTPLKKDAPQQQ